MELSSEKNSKALRKLRKKTYPPYAALDIIGRMTYANFCPNLATQWPPVFPSDEKRGNSLDYPMQMRKVFPGPGATPPTTFISAHTPRGNFCTNFFLSIHKLSFFSTQLIFSTDKSFSVILYNQVK